MLIADVNSLIPMFIRIIQDGKVLYDSTKDPDMHFGFLGYTIDSMEANTVKRRGKVIPVIDIHVK